MSNNCTFPLHTVHSLPHFFPITSSSVITPSDLQPSTSYSFLLPNPKSGPTVVGLRIELVHFCVVYCNMLLVCRPKPHIFRFSLITQMELLADTFTYLLRQFKIHCVHEKSNPQTMCDRNVKSEYISIKLCALVSEYICERTTKFHEKILFDSGVINIQIPRTKYLGFQYSVAYCSRITCHL